jgi:lactoylglutathione lyase
VTLRDGFPILHTADLPRLTAFYERLGLSVAYRFEEAYVGLEGPLKLGLAAVERLEPESRAALWFYCDDVDAEVERLRGHAQVRQEPQDMPWGERLAIVLDPDGNQVCLGTAEAGAQ